MYVGMSMCVYVCVHACVHAYLCVYVNMSESYKAAGKKKKKKRHAQTHTQNPTTTTNKKKKNILANRRSCNPTKMTFALSPSQAPLLRQGPAGSEGPREDELHGPPVPGRDGPVTVAQPGVLGHDADAADRLLAAHVPALHRPVALPQRHQDPHQQVSELLRLTSQLESCLWS